jgi:hypothetical protein
MPQHFRRRVRVGSDTGGITTGRIVIRSGHTHDATGHVTGLRERQSALRRREFDRDSTMIRVSDPKFQFRPDSADRIRRPHAAERTRPLLPRPGRALVQRAGSIHAFALRQQYQRHQLIPSGPVLTERRMGSRRSGSPSAVQSHRQHQSRSLAIVRRQRHPLLWHAVQRNHR